MHDRALRGPFKLQTGDRGFSIPAVAILQRAIEAAQNVLVEAADQARRRPLSQTIADRLIAIFDDVTVARLLALSQDYQTKAREVKTDEELGAEQQEPDVIGPPAKDT